MFKILCIGDSLTAGDDGNPSSFRTYRGSLQNLLASGGYSFDFIGSSNLVPAIGGDGDCEGYGGMSMDTLLGGVAPLSTRLPTILGSGVNPDIIVLYIGWNDVYNVPANIAARYVTVLAQAVALKPTTPFVVCTLAPQRGETQIQTGGNAAYAALNTQIRASAAAGPTVYLADLAAGPVGGSSAAWIEDLMNDIKLPPDRQIMAAGGVIPNYFGGIECSSFAGMQAANNLWSANPPQPGRAGGGGNLGPASLGPGHPLFINNVSALAAWFWTFAMEGHASNNAGVEVRNYCAMVKRKSTGQWQQLYSGGRGGPYLATNLGSGSDIPVIQRADGITTFMKPRGSSGMEIWTGDTVPSRGVQEFYGKTDREAIADAECFLMACQARLALQDPNGVNDIAQSRFQVKLGYDPYRSPGFDGNHYDWLGFPRGAQDGGSGRWKLLTSTDWVTVSVHTADCHWAYIGTPPPWGSWDVQWPYAKAPLYAITEAQFRAAPPPVPTYWEGSSSAGYASGDYWDVIHMLQAGADKVARVIYDAMKANGLLDGTVVPPDVPSTVPRPTRGVWFDRLTSTRGSWADTTGALLVNPTIVTTALAAGRVDVAYTQQVTATGSDPITWSATNLPNGLTINSLNGFISGTPTLAGSYAVVITATNGSDVPGVRTITVVVAANTAASVPPSIVTPQALPPGALNAPYNFQLVGAGTGPLVWSQLDGEVALGMTLSPSGVLSCPALLSEETYTFTVELEGAAEPAAIREFTLVVNDNADTGQWKTLSRTPAVWVRIPRN